MKEKHISQLQNALDKKSEEVKALQEQIQIKETEKCIFGKWPKAIERKTW